MTTKNEHEPITHHEQEALQFERIVFFSDAVFAIAITLLVIEVKVPEIGHPGHVTIEELQAQWPDEFRKLFPKLIGFVFSFLVIGQYWLNHHRNFAIIRRFDRGLLWRNLLLLMSIAFIPFTTGFYYEYTFWSVAAAWYYANIAVTGIIQWWLWHYATHNSRLIDPSTSPYLIDQIALVHLGVPIAFSLAFLGSLLDYPYGLSVTWVIIPLIAWFARRRYERQLASNPNAVNS